MKRKKYFIKTLKRTFQQLNLQPLEIYNSSFNNTPFKNLSRYRVPTAMKGQ